MTSGRLELLGALRVLKMALRKADTIKKTYSNMRKQQLKVLSKFIIIKDSTYLWG